MLATIRDDTRNMLNTQHIIPNSKRWDHSIIHGGGSERLKDLPTWLKVTTTLDKSNVKERPLGRLNQYTALNGNYIGGECPHTSMNVSATPTPLPPHTLSNQQLGVKKMYFEAAMNKKILLWPLKLDRSDDAIVEDKNLRKIEILGFCC